MFFQHDTSLLVTTTECFSLVNILEFKFLAFKLAILFDHFLSLAKANADAQQSMYAQQVSAIATTPECIACGERSNDFVA